jgi:hypothetical protein
LLSGDNSETMTRSDLVFALEHLHFGSRRNDGRELGALKIDRAVRDFIVTALRRNHGS